MKSYLKTILIAAIAFGLLAHFWTIEPMPWWPDTAIFGAFMGAMVALALLRGGHVIEDWRLLLRSWRRRQTQARKRTR